MKHKLKNICLVVHMFSRTFCYSVSNFCQSKSYPFHMLNLPTFPQVGDKLKDVDGVLCLYPLHHGVQCDESACPDHTSTAVHQEEILPAVRMCLPHSLDEVDHGDGIGRNTMVRPGQVVEQGDLKGSGICLIPLKQVEQTC